MAQTGRYKRVWARSQYDDRSGLFTNSIVCYHARLGALTRQVLRGETNTAAAAEGVGVRQGTMARHVRVARAQLAAGMDLETEAWRTTNQQRDMARMTSRQLEAQGVTEE